MANPYAVKMQLPRGLSLQVHEALVHDTSLSGYRLWLTTRRLIWAYSGEQQLSTLPLAHVAGLRWARVRNRGQFGLGLFMSVLGAAVLTLILSRLAALGTSGVDAPMILGLALVVVGLVLIATADRFSLEVLASADEMSLFLPIWRYQSPDMHAFYGALSDILAAHDNPLARTDEAGTSQEP